MTSKKGMELSVNFIVTFILAIVLFGMGIMFARMILGGGTDLTEETYTRFDEQIGNLVCSRGESVCISVNSKVIERDSIDVFPVTIQNDLPTKLQFRIIVELARAFRSDNTEICDISSSNTCTDEITTINWMPDEDTLILEPGERETVPILVKPLKDTLPGKYSFSVNFYSKDPEDSDTAYQDYPDEKPNKFYVTVE